MTADAAFLEAIVAEPDEMTHRLVYADWLEEHGDDAARYRAEFIRLQIARVALHPADPRSRALRDREVELLTLHGPDWSAELAGMTRRFAYHRGFVEEASLGLEQLLASGSRLFRIAPIRKLHLRQTLGLPGLLSGNRQTPRRLADLLDRIRVLDLTREYLTDATGMALLQLPRLPRLEGLFLGHNALSHTGIRTLAGSPVLAEVRQFGFTAPASAADALGELLHVPSLQGVETLSLSGARLGDRIVGMLAGAPFQRSLRELSLGHGNLSAGGLETLLALPLASRLEGLDLSFNTLGSAGARVLAAAALPRLDQLNLSRTDQGDEGATALAASTLLARLSSCDLSLNHLGVSGGMALARYPHPSRLLLLDLIYNRLQGDVREAIQARFGPEVCLFTR